MDRATRHGDVDSATTSFLAALQRLEQFARMIAEAHHLGVEPGEVAAPWTEAGQRQIVPVFAAVLPSWYQVGIAEWFGDTANFMLRRGAPVALVEEWSLVERYFRSVATVLRETTEPVDRRHAPPFQRNTHPPAVVDFTRVAALVAADAVAELSAATSTLLSAEQMHSGSPFDDIEQRVLEALAAGASVDDAATLIGYSRRTTYRILSKMQDSAGVATRQELIALALREHWVDVLVAGR